MRARIGENMSIAVMATEKIWTLFPLIHNMNPCIGNCFPGARATSHAFYNGKSSKYFLSAFHSDFNSKVSIDVALLMPGLLLFPISIAPNDPALYLDFQQLIIDLCLGSLLYTF